MKTKPAEVPARPAVPPLRGDDRPPFDMPTFLEALAFAMRKCRADGHIDHYPERLLVEPGLATLVPDERH